MPRKSKKESATAEQGTNADGLVVDVTNWTESEQRAYRDLQRIAHVMDEAFRIPCTSKTFGIDPIIGLIPFFGDIACGIVSLIFIARASPVLRKRTLSRMLCNVMVDFSVGSIPFFGDMFDFYFKANQRNLELFERHMKERSNKNGTRNDNTAEASKKKGREIDVEA